MSSKLKDEVNRRRTKYFQLKDENAKLRSFIRSMEPDSKYQQILQDPTNVIRDEYGNRIVPIGY